MECPEHLGSVLVSSVTADSRSITGNAITGNTPSGCLFVAVAGDSTAVSSINDAIARGAGIIIAGQSIADWSAIQANNIPLLEVANPRQALARIAANFFKRPADSLNIIAVTGTNGKTTSCWLLEQALAELGNLTLRLGTAGNSLRGFFTEPSTLTTPGPVELQQNFALALEHGAKFVSLEASSHALVQGRLAEVPVSVALFTNLSRDHLDYHETFVAYELAKRGLFDLLKPDGCAVVNIDLSTGQRFAEYCEKIERKVISFGSSTQADVKLIKTETTFLNGVTSGSAVSISYFGTSLVLLTPLIGDFNAENIVGVFTCLSVLGFSPEQSQKALVKATGAPGRLERITHAGRTVFVDYAHTPDALQRALIALRAITKPDNSLTVVFGCGGDRDTGKRPLMGEVAAKYADKVIITSDNPRTEDPLKIIAEIRGIACVNSTSVNSTSVNFTMQPDRALAISEAVSQMKVGDVLLVAGKGHENYQIFKDQTVEFSDSSTVLEALKRSFN